MSAAAKTLQQMLGRQMSSWLLRNFCGMCRGCMMANVKIFTELDINIDVEPSDTDEGFRGRVLSRCWQHGRGDEDRACMLMFAQNQLKGK